MPGGGDAAAVPGAMRRGRSVGGAGVERGTCVELLRGRITARGGPAVECQWEVLQLVGEEVLPNGDASAAGRPQHREVVLVLPGNPGVAHFYGPFLLALRGELGAGVGLLCCGYAGHSLARPENGGPFSVQEQVEVAAITAQRVLTAHPAAVLHIAGHSVGAHIALLIADRLPRRSIGTVVGLFPTVHCIADSPSGRLWPLLLPGVRHGVAAVGALFNCLPEQTRAAAVRCCKPELAPAGARAFDSIIARMALYRLLLNVLHMARTEFLSIRDVDPELVQRHASHLVLYYGVVDAWVPAEHRDVLHGILRAPLITGATDRGADRTYPKMVMDATGSPHAFVLTHSADVAAAVAQLLRRPAA